MLSQISINNLMSCYQSHKKKFQKCSTNLQRVNFFLSDNQPIKEYEFATKSDEKSAEIRETGNSHFKEKKYPQALESYTSALAWAKTKTIASLAYSNRSAVLARLGLYSECLLDIDRALAHSSDKVKIKLKSRQKEVLKMEHTKQMKRSSQNLENQNLIKIENSEKFGRHVIANRDVKIGEVLLVETPFASIVTQNLSLYCHECSNLCYNVIPCDNCSNQFFCSELCKKTSDKSHKYECSVLQILESLNLQKHDFLALKITLSLITSKNGDKLKQIRKLEGHSEKRPLNELFVMSGISAIVFRVFREKTQLFRDFPGFEDTFKELFLVVLQIIDINAVYIHRLEPNLAGYQTVKYACGLYLLYSLFNHSCNPNAFFYHDGSTLVVRALASIKKGEQCFISYHHTYSTVAKVTRQKELREKYHFSCMCKACEENWAQQEETKDFAEPFACVLMGILQRDHELLESMAPTFVQNLQWVEDSAPMAGIACLRQLVVDCFQVYESSFFCNFLNKC